MAEKESMQDTFALVMKQGTHELLNIVFNEDLTIITKFNSVMIALSLILLITYLVVPMSFRRTLERLDIGEKGDSYVSVTGFVCACAAIFLAFAILQKNQI